MNAVYDTHNLEKEKIKTNTRPHLCRPSPTCFFLNIFFYYFVCRIFIFFIFWTCSSLSNCWFRIPSKFIPLIDEHTLDYLEQKTQFYALSVQWIESIEWCSIGTIQTKDNLKKKKKKKGKQAKIKTKTKTDFHKPNMMHDGQYD